MAGRPGSRGERPGSRGSGSGARTSSSRPGSRGSAAGGGGRGRPGSRGGASQKELGTASPPQSPPPADDEPGYVLSQQVDIGEKFTMLAEELAVTKDELARRKESFMRKEVRYQQEIVDLKESLDEALGNRTQVQQMHRIRKTHGHIQEKITDMQERTAELLKQQEDSLVRNFKAYMKTELEGKTKKKEPQHSAEEWAEKFHEVQDLLTRTETQLVDSDRRNLILEEEAKRLRTQYRSQENDREFVVRQLVAVKRDNVRLRDELQKSNRSGRPGSASGMMMSGFGNVSGAGSDGSMGRPGTAESTHGGGGGGGSRPGTAGSSRMGAGTADRYRETVERLKKLLDKERKTLRTVRAAFATQMQSRTELEGFLADCIRDVRQELQRQRALGSAGPGGRHGRGAGGNRMSSNESLGGGGGGALDEFGPSEREQVVEMLLSQERVVKLLYAKTFEDPQDSSYQNSATDRSDPGRPATASGYAPTVGQQPQEGDYPPGRFRPSSAPSRKQTDDQAAVPFGFSASVGQDDSLAELLGPAN